MTSIEHAFIGMKDVRLHPEEKHQIFRMIQERIHTPVEKVDTDFFESRPLLESAQRLLAFLSFRHAGVAFTAVLAVIAGVTVNTAAQAALPGEVFYPLKQASEKVAGNFYLTPEARAAWEEEKLLRRLEEAEILLSMNRLGARERQEIVGTLRTHIDAMQDEIKALETQGNMDQAQEIDASLDESLQTHHEVLKTLASETSDKEQKLEALHVIHQVEEVLLPVRVSEESSSSAYSAAASSTVSSSAMSLPAIPENLASHHVLQRSADRKIRDASDLLLQLRLSESLETEKVDQLARLYLEAGKLMHSGSYVPSLQLTEEIIRRGHELLQSSSSSSSSKASSTPAAVIPFEAGSAAISPEVSTSSL